MTEFEEAIHFSGIWLEALGSDSRMPQAVVARQFLAQAELNRGLEELEKHREAVEKMKNLVKLAWKPGLANLYDLRAKVSAILDALADKLKAHSKPSQTES